MTRAAADVSSLLRRAVAARPVGGAVLSCGADPVYRFALWRSLSGAPPTRWLALVMLNPSTADHSTDDRTMLSVMRIARHLKYDGVVVANLFALRSKYPSDLERHADPVGPINDLWVDAVADMGESTFAAWGANGGLMGRGRSVLARLSAARDVFCFRRTKNGAPEHPLYLPTEVAPISYVRAGAKEIPA